MKKPYLITPDGKVIELSHETYDRIMELIQEETRDMPQRQSNRISATYGKYAGTSSLIEVLLDERAAESAREELARRLKLGPEKSGALPWREVREDW